MVEGSTGFLEEYKGEGMSGQALTAEEIAEMEREAAYVAQWEAQQP